MIRVRAYTLADNENHAPHVAKHGRRLLLTLANCKPGIREKAKDSEWIAAVTPVRMGYRLAFLMRVGGSWTREQYWKKFKHRRADSIYKPTVGGAFEQLNNRFHDAGYRVRDLSCNRILWSNEFYCFAEDYRRNDTIPRGLVLPRKYNRLCRSMRTRYGYFLDMPDDFVDWVKKQPGRRKSFKYAISEVHPARGNCQLHRTAACCTPKPRRHIGL